MTQLWLVFDKNTFCSEDDRVGLDDRIEHYLTSLAAIKYPEDWPYFLGLREKSPFRMFLDSGAFAVWSKGKEISIHWLVEVYRQVIDQVDHVVGLDRIPGSRGRTLTHADLAEAAEISWDAYSQMLTAGLPIEKLVPTVHHGEPMEYLERYLSSGAPLIALSPRKDVGIDSRIDWLRRCLPVATDSNFAPRARFHCFGDSNPRVIRAFPWHSCDSSSYIRSAGYGMIMVPRGDAFRSVKVSDREPKGNGGTSPVFAAMSRQEQEHIREVTQQYGYTIEELAERRIARIHFNALVSVETVNKWSFKPPTDQPFF